jgi:hypothetical protein
MQGTIHYRDLLKDLEKADHENGTKTVSMVFMQLDRKRKTGGKLVTVVNAQKCGLPYHCADHEMRGIIGPDGKKTAVHTRLIFEYNGLTVYP